MSKVVAKGRTTGTATGRCIPSVTSMTYNEDDECFELRLDDEMNPEFWLELRIPRSLLKRTREGRDFEPVEEDPENVEKRE